MKRNEYEKKKSENKCYIFLYLISPAKKRYIKTRSSLKFGET